MYNNLQKTWRVRKRENRLINDLVNEVDISPVIAQILINRGVTTPEAAREFLNAPREKIERPQVISGISEALELIENKLKKSQKILVYGDYDADGVAATAVMVEILRAVDADVDFYIPDRIEEGYDLNDGFVDWATDNEFGLIITVDCGIRAFDSVDIARKRGIDVIIADHHEPGESIPGANAVINPKLCREDSLRHLAGAGVSFLLAQSMAQRFGLKAVEGVYAGDMLDIVALGTIADAVPLVGYNRILVKHGLKYMPATSNTGLKALLEVEGLRDKEELTEFDAAYKLAPCINAAGRIGSAVEAVRLLLSRSPQEAWELAVKLHRYNAQRQLLEQQVMDEILERVKREIDFEREKVIVLGSHRWHPGVIGIAASRVMEAFHKPTILVSIESGVGKGSARSFDGFDLNEAFKYCSELFIKFGGHKLAGGFLIAEKNIELLRRRINSYAEDRLKELGATPKLDIDCEVLFSELDKGLMDQIQMLKPFGNGNLPPRLLYRKARVRECRLVGRGQEHLKMSLWGENIQFDGIGFRMAALHDAVKENGYVDIVFCPELNRYNGEEKIQLNLIDVSAHRGKLTVPAKTCGPGDDSILLKELLGKNTRVQYIGFAEKVAKDLAIFSKNAGYAGCFIFPLQSMAVDFERSLRKSGCRLNISRVDGSTLDHEALGICSGIVTGDVDIVITTFGCWKYMDGIRRAVGNRQNLLCVHLGFWGKEVPLCTQLVSEVRELLKGWKSPVVFVGSGTPLYSREIKEILGITEVFSQQNLLEPEIIKLCSGSERLQFIRDLCLNKLPQTVFFVNSGKEAVALARQIAGLGFIKPHGIRYYYGGLTASQRDLVINDFNEGTAKILVSSRNLEQHMVRGVERVVIYSFPLNLFDFGRFIIAPKVYLAYNNNDIQRSLKYVARVCPDRDLLNFVYKEARMVKSRNANLDELRNALGVSSRINGHVLKTALAIIKELELIGNRKSGVPGKVDVSQSWRFREAKKELMSYHDLLNLLESPDHEIATSYQKI